MRNKPRTIRRQVNCEAEEVTMNHRRIRKVAPKNFDG